MFVEIPAAPEGVAGNSVTSMVMDRPTAASIFIGTACRRARVDLHACIPPVPPADESPAIRCYAARGIVWCFEFEHPRPICP